MAITDTTMATINSGNSDSGSLKQWACKVISFSSEYDSWGWSSSAILGEPKVYPRYGDNMAAWTPAQCDSEEYIEVEYKTPVFASEIHIYETFNCGSGSRVSVQSPRGSWDTVWETDTAQHIEESRIFSPEIKCPGYKTRALRLDIDCSVSESWVEIDAVQLVGRKFKFDLPPPLSSVVKDFAKLLNDKESSDVVFSIQDRNIHAHRIILSVRSQRLKDMIAGTKQGSVIPVKDVSYDAFLGVLHYIYSASVPCTKFSPDMLVDVWRAATKLQIDGLRSYCTMMIDERLNADNVIDVFTSASDKEPMSVQTMSMVEDLKGSKLWKKYSIPCIFPIREVCLEFLASNLGTVSRTPQFKELSQPRIMEIVQLSTSRLSQE